MIVPRLTIDSARVTQLDSAAGPVLVELQGSDGSAGIGEIGSSPLAFPAAARLCGAIIGLDAAATTAIGEKLNRMARMWKAPIDAAGGVQCAVWDLVGRHLRAPLHVLFGVSRPRPVLAPVRIDLANAAEPVDTTCDRVVGLVGEHSYEALLIAVPTGSEARGTLVVRELRRRLGSQMRIRVECTGDDDFGSADRLLADIDDLDIEYVAGLAWSLPCQEKLRRRTGVPLASPTPPGDALASWVRASAGEVLIGDPVGWGGIAAFRAHASVCRAFSIDIAVSAVRLLGPALATSLQLIAGNAASGKGFHAVPHGAQDGFIVTPEEYALRNGRLALPAGPGIGWSVDPSRLKKRTFAEAAITSPLDATQ